MKAGRTGLLAGAVVIIAAAGAAWPGKVETIWPAGGSYARGLRAALPATIAAILPADEATKPAAQSAQSGVPAGKPASESRANGAGPGRPPAPVMVVKAAKGPLPLRIDAVGTVQPIASVAIKTRVDATIDQILVGDGAKVKAGDVLVRLDDRQVQAQIKAAEASLAKDKATLEQAQRDVQRYQDLLSKGAGTQLNFDNARTTLASTKALIMGDEAQLENLKVQLGWYTMTAPIPGRVGTFSAKAGNIIRSGDNTSTGTLTTIVQTAPIYVVFSVPQANLPDLRAAVESAAGAEVVATPQGTTKQAKGRVAVLDNQIDSGTGTIAVRGAFDNSDDLLWAGQLCNVRVVVRVDPQAITVPRSATQSGQAGNFVYVIDKGVAHVRPVKIARTQDDVDVVAEGLSGGETVVTDGALLLTDGARVEVRTADARNGAI